MSKLTMSLAGDAMLGRLVDQLQPIHTADENAVNHLKEIYPHLANVDESYPFGNLKSLLKESDLSILNLETTITTHDDALPKTFNFRMHPHNVQILKSAGISYVSLANNHILDYGKKGLMDTIDCLTRSNIAFAGVGKTRIDAVSPTYKYIKGVKFAFLSASDHPKSWSAFEQFHYHDSDSREISALSAIVRVAKANSDFVLFSFHWGPNYQWYPDTKIRRLARKLIDLGVDLIHGHSSHHVQGIEIYKGKPIFYGMGDFVDDYAVDASFRNDLSFLYQIEYNVYETSDIANMYKLSGWNTPYSVLPGGFNVKKVLHLAKLTLIPTKITLMQVNRITEKSSDLNWLFQTMKRLCFDLGTKLEYDYDSDKNPIFRVSVKQK